MSSSGKIAVIGAGTMGADLAFDLASHNHEVLLKDLVGSALERARKRMQEMYRILLFRDRKQYGSLKLDDILRRVTFTTAYEGFGDVRFVIENIVEDQAAKRTVYGELASACGADTIYAANTSCVPITRVGSFVPRPDRVLGMHFLNPVPLKKLVEVIVGYHTSEATLGTARELLGTLGKQAVVVKDSPGFVTNRILMLTINEAAFVVHDRIAEPEQVDLIFTEGFSHKMGPLATGDLIGLDTILKSLEVLHDCFKDPKYRPCPLLVQMVDAGLLGRKSGKGFFDYGGRAQ